jgi:membrane protein implicated in regulation of membrane protease activity
MSYTVEWMGGVVVFGIVLLLLIVPEFAVLAVVVATSAVFVVALAALVALVALTAAVLVSPFLLVRSVRRRRGQRRTRLIHAPSGIPSRSAALIEAASRDAA